MFPPMGTLMEHRLYTTISKMHLTMLKVHLLQIIISTIRKVWICSLQSLYQDTLQQTTQAATALQMILAFAIAQAIIQQW